MKLEDVLARSHAAYITENVGSRGDNVIIKHDYNRITPEHALKVINASPCKWMLDKEPLFRGIDYDVPDFCTIDASKIRRKSANTSNYYTLILDNHPEMHGWPKRSRSLIATSNVRRALDYGRAYAIIPLDGANIGVVNREDIFFTKIHLFDFKSEIFRLNSVWSRSGFPDDDWDAFKEKLNDPKAREELEMRIGVPEHIENLLPRVLDAYSPKALGFDRYSAATFPRNISRNTEVWISGPCVAVSYGMADLDGEIFKTDRSAWMDLLDMHDNQ